MTKKAVLWTAIGTGLAAFAVILFLASGFRLFAILTPSMGQTAPVGTLVVSHPADTYQPGEIISFERVSRVYTHRIVALSEQGGFVTKGDLNGANDPLPVDPTDIIGKAVLIAPGFGWLLMGVPWLLLGGVVVFGLSLIGKLSQTWRWVIRISGWTLVFALVALWLRPWINLSMLGFVPADTGGGVLMHVVNTGLFPLDADGVRLVSGEDAVLHITEQNAKGFYTLTPGPALNLWQRLALLAFCLVPLAAALMVRPEPHPDDAAIAAAAAARPRRRKLLIGSIVLAIVVSVAAVNQTVAYGSYAAKIQNTQNAAGTRTFFNCTRAVTSTANATPYAAWALGEAASTSANQTDLTGNGRTGRYTTAAVVTGSQVNGDVGCNQDSPKAAVRFNGDKCLYLNANYASSGYYPTTFSLEAWFRTDTTSNGKIIGFGSSRNTASDGNYDRHIYIDPQGRVVFGVYPGSVKIVYTTGKDYADNKWHHVVATLANGTQTLYVDGVQAMSRSNASPYAENLHGYWKVGCGALSGWQTATTAATGSTTLDYNGPSYFTGWIQFAAIYSNALSAAQVTEHYNAGKA